jgi:hypothetical protein
VSFASFLKQATSIPHTVFGFKADQFSVWGKFAWFSYLLLENMPEFRLDPCQCRRAFDSSLAIAL